MSLMRHRKTYRDYHQKYFYCVVFIDLDDRDKLLDERGRASGGKQKQISPPI